MKESDTTATPSTSTRLGSSHAALSPQLLQPDAPQPPPTAHRASFSTSALSDASMVSSNDQNGSNATRFARDPASPARNRTETKHRVSCSMVDKMDVQDSAQRRTSQRSQHSARSTDDSLQLSMRSAMCAVCAMFPTTARSRLSPRVRAVVFAFKDWVKTLELRGSRFALSGC